MPKFIGAIGFATQEESSPGVWTEIVHEHRYSGDIVRYSRSIASEQSVNPELSVNNSISILADAFLRDNFFAIRYARWAGVRWTVDTVDVVSPRLLLRLGGVYSGPTPSAS